MNTFVKNSVATLAIAALAAGAAFAQGQPAGDGPPVLAKTIAPARSGTRLLVSSGAFTGGQTLPEKYTQNGDNVSPPVDWARGPVGTQSYVVLAEDSGVNRHDPIVHWVVYDIPSTVTSLSSSMPTEDKLNNGAVQGKNIAGKVGYIGPKPPAGQTHPYHFQVFALNTKLNLEPMADRNAVVNAMKGHVLAVGDLIGNYTGK